MNESNCHCGQKICMRMLKDFQIARTQAAYIVANATAAQIEATYLESVHQEQARKVEEQAQTVQQRNIFADARFVVRLFEYSSKFFWYKVIPSFSGFLRMCPILYVCKLIASGESKRIIVWPMVNQLVSTEWIHKLIKRRGFQAVIFGTWITYYINRTKYSQGFSSQIRSVERFVW